MKLVTMMRDLIALAGVVSFFTGLYMAWPPAAWIVGGLIAVAVVVCSVVIEHRAKNRG